MKWVLLWVAISGSGGISSGSADFASGKACEAGRKALQSTIDEISIELNNQSGRLVRSRCLEDQGGDQPRKPS